MCDLERSFRRVWTEVILATCNPEWGLRQLIRRAPAAKRRRFRLLVSNGPLVCLLGCALAIDSFVVLLDLLAQVDASLFVSLLACGLAMGLIDIQFIKTTKRFPNKRDNLTVQKRQ